MQIIDKAMDSESTDIYLVVKEDNKLFSIPECGYKEAVELERKAKKIPDEDLSEIKGIYKHFKGNKYEVIDIVFSSETLEKYIYYKPLYENKVFDAFLRPYDMFFSKVDKQKYSDVNQEYRFEKLEDCDKK